MIAPELISNTNEDIRLVAPDIERDAPLSVEWMSGDEGRQTQNLMGVADKDIHEHSLEESKDRIRAFIESDHEIVWMIEANDQIIGAVEVHLVGSKYLSSPSIHIMIGDRLERGRGVGKEVLRMAVAFLQNEQGIELIFSRYRTNNKPSEQLLIQLGFEEDGEPYTDKDGLKWQNVILRGEF